MKISVEAMMVSLFAVALLVGALCGNPLVVVLWALAAVLVAAGKDTRR